MQKFKHYCYTTYNTWKEIEFNYGITHSFPFLNSWSATDNNSDELIMNTTIIYVIHTSILIMTCSNKYIHHYQSQKVSSITFMNMNTAKEHIVYLSIISFINSNPNMIQPYISYHSFLVTSNYSLFSASQSLYFVISIFVSFKTSHWLFLLSIIHQILPSSHCSLPSRSKSIYSLYFCMSSASYHHILWEFLYPKN